MRQLQIDFQQCLRPNYTLLKGDNNNSSKDVPSIAPNWIPPNNLLLD